MTALLELSYLEPLFGTSNPFVDMLKSEGAAFLMPSLGDLNGDGMLEVILGTAGNGDGLVYGINTGSRSFFMLSLCIFLGSAAVPRFEMVTGAGSPVDAINATFATAPAPALVDIDGDGDLDVFVGTAIGDVHFFENIGADEFHSYSDGNFRHSLQGRISRTHRCVKSVVRLALSILWCSADVHAFIWINWI